MTTHLLFLGTAAGAPFADRHVSALAIVHGDGSWWLLDAGEGTGARCRDAGLDPARCDLILITHLHGDHCWGLPGFIIDQSIAKRQEPVTVIGPTGIADLLGGIFRLCSARPGHPVDVREVPGAGAAGPPIPAPLPGWTMRPIPITHDIPSLAWLFEDHGARRLLVCGDTMDADAAIPFAAGVGTVVREVTFEDHRVDRAIQTGHSTPAMTGAFAAALAAGMLIVTHVGKRTGTGAGVETTRRATAARCPGVVVDVARELVPLPVGHAAGMNRPDAMVLPFRRPGMQ